MNRRSPLLRWGLALTGALLLVAAAAPLLAPYDPAEQVDPAATLYRPPGTALAAIRLRDGGWLLADRVSRTAAGLAYERLGKVDSLPAARVANLTATGVADRRRFLLGSDRFGRDVLSRVVYGTRVSLAAGLLSVVLALTLGVALGSAAAMGGPLADAVIMRGVDALLAFPGLFLMIALAALFQPGSVALVLILGALNWMEISRLVRAEILSLQEREFVLAAKAIGERPIVILWRHLLPNALTPVLVQSTLLVGNLILVESSLSFLGLGVQPPTPSWGNMISEGRDALAAGWWVATFPGAAIAFAVIAFNLLGDGLRDALDPRALGRFRRPAEAEVPEATLRPL
ncbi:MAG TPA: ABC transporter permease [Thermoanaerobaculia bacterium]|nr:ABC transporter permease [Thermoanaerobaculia bacterium]